MAYASRSRFRKSAPSSYRRRRFTASARSSTRRMGKTRYVKKVTRRLNRKEIKYDDDFFNLNAWEKYSQSIEGQAGAYVNYVLGGVLSTQTFQIARALDAGGNGGITINAASTKMMPNCLTNIDTGTTASSRIGNMVQPRYLSMKCVLNAAATNETADPETLGKFEVIGSTETAITRFCRTSVKVMIIRDKSMNEKGFVSFNDVFDVPMQGESNASKSPFLWNRKIDRMGRYEILKEGEFQLDADDPQKSFSWVVPLKGVPIRYNGNSSANAIWVEDAMSTGTSTGITPEMTVFRSGVVKQSSSESQSMTNGIYILAVAHIGTKPNNYAGGNIVSPSIVFSSRVSFEDN